MTGLSRDVTELIRLAQAGNACALEELVQQNTGLVRSVARRFMNRGVEYDDLCQIGHMGMIKAIRKFDLSRGLCFSTYAVPLIIGEIRRFLRDDGAIKIGRELKRRSAVIMAESEKFAALNGREPTVSELSSLCGLTEEEVTEGISAAAAPVSIFEPAGEKTIEERLGADFTPELNEKIALSQAMNGLSDEERQIIVLRYFRGMTQADAGRALGVSQVTVSRRESAALAKLKSELSDE